MPPGWIYQNELTRPKILYESLPCMISVASVSEFRACHEIEIWPLSLLCLMFEVFDIDNNSRVNWRVSVNL